MTNSDFSDSVWCQIKLQDRDLLLVGVIYRSPSSTLENNTELNALLDLSQRHKHAHLLIMEDFNYPDVDFVNCTSDSSKNAPSTLLLLKIDEILLKQHVTESTRVKEGLRPSM